MKIASALQTQKALAAEISHLRNLEQQHGWAYRSYGHTEHPDAEWQPNFNFDDNHQQVLKLQRLHTKLSQAISRTNLEADVVGVNDTDYADWA